MTGKEIVELRTTPDEVPELFNGKEGYEFICLFADNAYPQPSAGCWCHILYYKDKGLPDLKSKYEDL